MRQTAAAVEFITNLTVTQKAWQKVNHLRPDHAPQYTAAYWSNLMSYLSHFHGGLAVKEERSGDGAPHCESPCESPWKLWMEGREKQFNIVDVLSHRLTQCTGENKHMMKKGYVPKGRMFILCGWMLKPRFSSPWSRWAGVWVKLRKVAIWRQIVEANAQHSCT